VAGAENAGEIIAARRAAGAKSSWNRNSPYVLLDAVQAAVSCLSTRASSASARSSNQVERAVEGRAFRISSSPSASCARSPACRRREIAARSSEGRHRRRRHHGRRHRDVLRQRRHPGDLVDASAGGARPRPGHIRKNYERSVARQPEAEQKATAHGPDPRRRSTTPLADADLIIEAVFENMDL
jgi:hypothetical protein